MHVVEFQCHLFNGICHKPAHILGPYAIGPELFYRGFDNAYARTAVTTLDAPQFFFYKGTFFLKEGFGIGVQKILQKLLGFL